MKHQQKLLKVLSAFSIGVLFGLGLIVAGMSNPAKVLGFLDLFGAWDPSLAFVMAGAIGVGVFGFARANKIKQSFFDEAIHLPGTKKIDTRLVVGSLLFGMGWGIAGICPGPALVLVGMGSIEGVTFSIAMLVGMWLYSKFLKVHTA